ncbi:MAG: STAS domain-containing protein [Armatimonadetes bacterium]|nr:STAS domain-containing protein [Armatimonadota bacterium]
MSESKLIHISRGDGTVIIEGRDALNYANSDALRDGLADAAASASKVIVDFRKAYFIDSAILEYLARTVRTMRETGGTLDIRVADKSQPLYILEVVGFPVLMKINVYASEENSPGPDPRPLVGSCS